MKTAGYVVFVLGLATAAILAGRPVTGTSAGERLFEWAELVALPFVGALTLAVVGALMSRKPHSPVKATGVNQQIGGSPDALLANMLTRIERTRTEHPGDPSDGAIAAFHELLDAILEEEVPMFLEHRQQLAERLGMLGFAELMGNFSAFERNAARAWSALTDEAVDEFQASLGRAMEALKATQNQLVTPGS